MTSDEHDQRVPQHELDAFVGELRKNIALFDTTAMISAYRSCGLEVKPDPLGTGITDLVAAAVREHRPLSVIRLGDAELALLSYRIFPGTPVLDRAVAETTVLRQADSFRVDDATLLMVRDMLHGALAFADVIGVLGLWWIGELTEEALVRQFLESHKGVCGQLRARVYLPMLARRGMMYGRTIASAHLYLGVVRHLSRLVDAAERIILISSYDLIRPKLEAKYPGKPIQWIGVGHNRKDPRRRTQTPYFLAELFDALPQALGGTLCLIGAGPWAKIYCGWVKQRGGVAVDIGSGFDLMEGKITRPIHRKLDPELVSALVQ